MRKFLAEFKAFAMRGNVVDMAIGVVIGAAFGKIVTSLVGDVIMPPVGRLMGGVNFSDLFFSLNGQSYPNLAAAQAAGAPTLNYGMFINTIINFLIVAFCVFMLIKLMNSVKKKDEAAAKVDPPPPTKEEALLTEIRDLLKK